MEFLKFYFYLFDALSTTRELKDVVPLSLHYFKEKADMLYLYSLCHQK